MASFYSNYKDHKEGYSPRAENGQPFWNSLGGFEISVDDLVQV